MNERKQNPPPQPTRTPDDLYLWRQFLKQVKVRPLSGKKP
jgi:hypothetical protein